MQRCSVTQDITATQILSSEFMLSVIYVQSLWPWQEELCAVFSPSPNGRWEVLDSKLKYYSTPSKYQRGREHILYDRIGKGLAEQMLVFIFSWDFWHKCVCLERNVYMHAECIINPTWTRGGMFTRYMVECKILNTTWLL